MPRVFIDTVDLAYSRRVHCEDCRLAIRHAIERDDLRRAQMRRVVEDFEAPLRERPSLELVEADD